MIDTDKRILVGGGQGHSGEEVIAAAFGWGVCSVVLFAFVIGAAAISGLL
jgi:hypothetical protein